MYNGILDSLHKKLTEALLGAGAFLIDENDDFLTDENDDFLIL